MASIPASIDVTFNANYTGQHRVCWRIGSSGVYDCTTTVVCGGGGNPCSTSIGITVDNETCDDVTFEGYVQASCEDVGSLNGRVPFSITFTPNPSCKPYRITCGSVAVGSIVVTVPGSTYLPLPTAAPAVAITGGGGTGATATALVGNRGVLTTTITAGGTGYNGGGTAVFSDVPATTLIGIGTGATFDVTVTSGIVTLITVVLPGVDYDPADTFEFSNTHLGGSGSGFVGTVDTNNTGRIQSVSVTAGGSGYSSIPDVTIDPAPNPVGNASADAVMADCGLLDYGNDCDGSAKPDIVNLALGSSFVTCYSEIPPVLGGGYNIVADNNACCFDCLGYIIEKEADVIPHPATLVYTACTSRDTIQQTINNGDSFTICAVVGSIVVYEQTTDGVTEITETICP